MRLFSNTKFHKYKKHGTAFLLRKWGAAGLAFVLCFMLISSPVNAASTGVEHHKDTYDYCMRVHDVTVGLQELEGKSESENAAIVQSASACIVYTWY